MTPSALLQYNPDEQCKPLIISRASMIQHTFKRSFLPMIPIFLFQKLSARLQQGDVRPNAGEHFEVVVRRPPHSSSDMMDLVGAAVQFDMVRVEHDVVVIGIR
jgi:hypothetical protein